MSQEVQVDHGRSRLTSRIETALVWLLAHGSRVWPFVVFGAVLAVSWHAVREIQPRIFRVALRDLDPAWLGIAGLVTVANIAAMGFYDVAAFRHTRSRWSERWRYGAVTFAWSNFLTLGPLAGPAMRFWLYRPAVDQLSDLHAGVVAIAIAFVSGLVGWTLSVELSTYTGAGVFITALQSLVLVLAIASLGRIVVQRFEKGTQADEKSVRLIGVAFIGWLDWLLAAAVFIACLKSIGSTTPVTALARTFFLGQALGLASLVPGGFGSADTFWIGHLPLGRSGAAAVLAAYRLIYYVVPWMIASLLLLAWVMRLAPRRLEIARRIVAGLVGGGGVLIMLSSASPALYARLSVLERFVPLPLVEAGQVTAALAGLLLLVLARGLARGYRAAFRATLVVLTIAGLAAMLKGFDWEEALVLGSLAIAIGSQSTLFDRASRGDWLAGSDLVLAFTALAMFLTFGTVTHRVSANTFDRLTRVGYRVEAPRFLRTAASMVLAVIAGSLYVLLRSPVGFKRLDESEVTRALKLNAQFGLGTTPLIVVTRDKAVFFDERGFCLYRTTGPYLVVFSDPVVRTAGDRAAFLDALFAFAGEIDRRPVFYQMSLDWMPVLHDRGYDFFKLGEEAHVQLKQVTLEGHQGKFYRQILRRAERDGVRFRILPPCDLPARMTELTAVSDDWLRTKKLAERQFSVGAFSEDYILRFPVAIVEETNGGRLLAFANLLEGPRHQEISVDLMRYRQDGPRVMDFLLVALLLEAKNRDYQRFNLGMAPLAWVGEQRGAHPRERLARLLFQRGEQWYNLQGLRFYKQKFGPDWVPRYMAYQSAWEWPIVIAYVSALIAGGWSRILVPARDRTPPAETAGEGAGDNSSTKGQETGNTGRAALSAASIRTARGADKATLNSPT